MKRSITRTLAGLFLVLATACAGTQARTALTYDMELAWPRVQEDVNYGVQASPGDPPATLENVTVQAQKMTDALAAEDVFGLRIVNWPLLETYATRGVVSRQASGAIGVGVADSRLERIRNFRDAYTKVTELR